MSARALVVVALSGLLAACGAGGLKCPDDAAYRSAREAAPIVIPPALDTPPADSALVVPPVSDAAEARPPGVPECLEHPPSYFPERPRPEV